MPILGTLEFTVKDGKVTNIKKPKFSKVKQ